MLSNSKLQTMEHKVDSIEDGIYSIYPCLYLLSTLEFDTYLFTSMCAIYQDSNKTETTSKFKEVEKQISDLKKRLEIASYNDICKIDEYDNELANIDSRYDDTIEEQSLLLDTIDELENIQMSITGAQKLLNNYFETDDTHDLASKFVQKLTQAMKQIKNTKRILDDIYMLI